MRVERRDGARMTRWALAVMARWLRWRAGWDGTWRAGWDGHGAPVEMAMARRREKRLK